MQTHTHSRHTDRTPTSHRTDEACYRWLCCACGERSDWQYTTHDAAAVDGDAHANTNPCGDFLVVVQSPDDVDRRWVPSDPNADAHGLVETPTPQQLKQTITKNHDTDDHVVDPNDSPTEIPEPGRFEIPEGVGYRLVGNDDT